VAPFNRNEAVAWAFARKFGRSFASGGDARHLPIRFPFRFSLQVMSLVRV